MGDDISGGFAVPQCRHILGEAFRSPNCGQDMGILGVESVNNGSKLSVLNLLPARWCTTAARGTFGVNWPQTTVPQAVRCEKLTATALRNQGFWFLPPVSTD